MPADSTTKTILIVEDDEIARAGLDTILTGRGHRVLLAAHGDEALVHLQTGPAPDLILLDMIQPGWFDGWQFLNQRQHGLLAGSIPIVIMTGLGVASWEWARALGAVELLRKPINVDALLETVERYLGPQGKEEAREVAILNA